ncbi:MAG: hypothetical protein OEW68_15070 [Gammaproteobacteria bacterium]|nr:hypothetical protein [Gammaproteobacteria bacterium]MDH4316148.1 hypothetical protein [Gammaproteobacteria bacterium]MDH5215346.1 hypothetical protein [Gammaproteobacteria bacterium]MDH5501404.1 hypothetical protein [Gammaproteobacteria bacterium]
MKVFNILTLSLGLMVLPVAGTFARDREILEGVTVTTQKREQSAQDMPVIVTVISGEDVLQLGSENSNDIADYTPGLTNSPV